MKHNTITHVKFVRLKRRLQLPQYAVIGVLEALWIMAMHSAQNGAIGKHTNEDIAACIEWAGNADKLITDLVETGWLDADPVHRLIVHDWNQHCPTFIKGTLARTSKKFATPSEKAPIVTPLKEATENDCPIYVVPTKPKKSVGPLEEATIVTPSEEAPIESQYLNPNLNLNLKPLLSPLTPTASWELTEIPDNEPASELTRQWIFYRRGSVATSETMPKMLENFTEILRINVNKYQQFLDAIKDPARDRSEFFWQWKDRVIGKTPAKKIKSTQQILDEMAADPTQKELLELAFGN